MNGSQQPGASPGDGPHQPPRIPFPRAAADDHGHEPRVPAPRDPAASAPAPAASGPPADAALPHTALPHPGAYDHAVLKSLLGAWALAACPAGETAIVEAHLTDCASCAEEALRLRDAVGLLRREESLDLDPALRVRVLEGCLDRRPARIPVPGWAGPYDAETARLDALLRDMDADEWDRPVRLRWFDGECPRARSVTVAKVVGHLTAVDGQVAAALGLPDPLPEAAGSGYTVRTEAYWRAQAAGPPGAVHPPWREQSHALVRAAGFASARVTELAVPGTGLAVPDAFLDRAFECWVHALDIAEAVDYPHGNPAAEHLHQLIDLAARALPTVLADRRRTGLAAPVRRLSAAGAPGRTLHLEIEGPGGGDWYIALDSPGALGSPRETVATVALDGVEFCQLAAGHVPPLDAAAGAEGDREAVRDVLLATASLSRL
ncbi:maleylpyruvate isomerase N-terminal domain-containing protein [Streptomyces sp. TRM 70351]|uniref:maleylpyruvate isomerase N-terminal domain-containing protein n=1 Tax=Streptomyces sp. TRM 70351 TaxID=3116552 RepID=UPI002E7AE09E|nr:maleylpyruvate isomerase N-terminal domain-containing protein [Streptomyces sp. TRM 70351]MEE1929561.1 maleylpyruvate isomerase N-terminal domain-containing protein [Streptomyces sp. TRM 70351]